MAGIREEALRRGWEESGCALHAPMRPHAGRSQAAPPCTHMQPIKILSKPSFAPPALPYATAPGAALEALTQLMHRKVCAAEASQACTQHLKSLGSGG